MASTNLAEQEEGKFLADEILKNNIEKQITDDGEIRVKTNRTMINKYSNNEDNSKGLKIFFDFYPFHSKNRNIILNMYLFKNLEIVFLKIYLNLKMIKKYIKIT